MSRGASSAVLAPAGEPGGETPPDSDLRLVAAVRAGDDRAFEALYERYQRRIHAYVLGMVKDHGRAEDVTQEVFVSALRRMRATDRAIAFKPWIYEIAKNACIDAFRRSRRAEEVSIDAEEGLAPADHSRLCSNGPSPEAAVAAKHDLETLCGAFGGLSESHHQILVLRELEGLTYEQIGERMGMTRPAVESTLFRARRRLTEEYDELVSGARCLRVQSIIASAVSGAVGVRDSRRLSRHLSHCQPCRREALAAGLNRGLLVRRPAAKRIVEKVAGFLPLPAFLRLRRGADGAPPSSEPPGMRLAAHLPALSDQLGGPWAKAAAGAALLVAGTGAGIGAHRVVTYAERPAAHPAVLAPAAHKNASSPAATATAAPGATVTAPATSSGSGGARGDERRRSTSSTGGSKTSGSPAGRSTSPGGATPSAPSGSSGSTPASSGSASSKKHTGLPVTTSDPVKKVAGDAGDAAGGAGAAVGGTVDGVGNAVDGTVQGATGAVQGAVQGATDGVNGAVQGVTGDGPVAGAVKGATDTVNGAVGAAAGTVNGLTGAVTGTTGGLLGGNSAGR